MSHEYYLHVSTASISLYTTLHYITLHYPTLHYITLHYTTLHYITLHCTALHYITYYTIRAPYHNILVHGYLVPHQWSGRGLKKLAPGAHTQRAPPQRFRPPKTCVKVIKHGKTLFPSLGYRFLGGITWYPGILTLGIPSQDHGSSMSSRDDPKGPKAIRFQSLRYNVIVCSKYITLW